MQEAGSVQSMQMAGSEDAGGWFRGCRRLVQSMQEAGSEDTAGSEYVGGWFRGMQEAGSEDKRG